MKQITRSHGDYSNNGVEKGIICGEGFGLPVLDDLEAQADHGADVEDPEYVKGDEG